MPRIKAKKLSSQLFSVAHVIVWPRLVPDLLAHVDGLREGNEVVEVAFLIFEDLFDMHPRGVVFLKGNVKLFVIAADVFISVNILKFKLRPRRARTYLFPSISLKLPLALDDLRCDTVLLTQLKRFEPIHLQGGLHDLEQGRVNLITRRLSSF